ncbi:CD59 glycoprotein-like [Erythrolamprus reginae]|uniref:CD59 glycoprotein-like n=1 Tax=Erythrolamprus reginae TaxID=121349 RepID=UPI00396CF96B
MKSLLVTAVVTTFVLALFFRSGNALMCYDCRNTNCNETINCVGAQDTCIVIHYSGGRLSSCWSRSRCNINYLSEILHLNSYKYKCCNWDLCNNAPNVVANKIVLSGSFLLTVVHLLKPLVWN